MWMWMYNDRGTLTSRYEITGHEIIGHNDTSSSPGRDWLHFT